MAESTTTATIENDSSKKKEKTTDTAANITAEQVQEMLKSAKEQARTEEKNKLYKDLEKTESKVKEMTKLYDELKAEKTAKEKELEEARKAKMTVEEKLTTIQQEAETSFGNITKQIDEKFEEHAKTVTELEGRLNISQLDAHKERRLRELTESKIGFIPELISGNTPEEVDKSIENSVAKMKDIAEQIKGEKIEGANYRFPTVTNPSNPPGGKNDEILSKIDEFRPTDERAFFERLKTLGSSHSDGQKKLSEDREQLKKDLRRRWEAGKD